MARTPTPLRLAVVQSGLSQREIAEQVGLNETRFSRIVNGLHCDHSTRQRIALALGRNVCELWPNGDDEPVAA